MLNQSIMAAMPVPEKGQTIQYHTGKVDGQVIPMGFATRVTANGAKSFVLHYRSPADRRERRVTVGQWPQSSVSAAVRRARELRQQIDKGVDPFPSTSAPPLQAGNGAVTVADVVERYLAGHADKRLRSADTYRRFFERFVVPHLGAMPVHSLRRSHIADMLDKVEAAASPIMADRLLGYFGSALHWHAQRDDEFTVPVLAGLKRIKGRDAERSRVLTDDEIRTIWAACGEVGRFGDMCRFLLLTGQRRGDVAGMVRGELEGDVWTIPAARYKTKRDQVVFLSPQAMQLVGEGTGIVFLSPTGKVIGKSGFFKRQLDRATGPLAPWCIHDLRRTARSLMGRAGVRPDIAERVVGHSIGNAMLRIYDRHSYEVELRAAGVALAQLIDRILNPAQNVVSIVTR